MSAWTEPRADESCDVLFDRRVRLLQAKDGYRTSVDAMLLAWFAVQLTSAEGRVVDLGAGSGLVTVLMGLSSPAADFTLVEKQPQLAWRARRNLRLNGVTGRVLPLELANGVPSLGPFDVVVSNPPYFRRGSGILPVNQEKLTAHYEGTAPVERFAQVAAGLLASRGTCCFVFPADETERLVVAMQRAGLGQMKMMMVHHRDLEKKPTRVLLAARHGALDVIALPPLQLHPEATLDHTYSQPLQDFLAGLKQRH